MSPIIFRNTQNALNIVKCDVQRSIQGMLSLLSLSDWSVSIWFCNNKFIRKFNREWRGINRPTDILTFANYKAIRAGVLPTVPSNDLKDLCQILISCEYVKSTCLKSGTDPYKDLELLYAHGLCHAIGYDHENDDDFEIMKLKENYILSNYKKFLPPKDIDLDSCTPNMIN